MTPEQLLDQARAELDAYTTTADGNGVDRDDLTRLLMAAALHRCTADHGPAEVARWLEILVDTFSAAGADRLELPDDAPPLKATAYLQAEWKRVLLNAETQVPDPMAAVDSALLAVGARMADHLGARQASQVLAILTHKFAKQAEREEADVMLAATLASKH